MLQVNNPYGSESGVPGGGRYLRAGKNVLFNKNQAFFDETRDAGAVLRHNCL
jgi:hypothetical protein